MMHKNSFRFTALRYRRGCAALFAAALFFCALPPQAGAQMLVDGAVADPSARYIRAQEFIRNGKKIEAKAELDILTFTNGFILADYAAYDLAAMALAEKDFPAALAYLRGAASALENSPARKEANRVALLASCQVESSDGCAKALSQMDREALPPGYWPSRMAIEAARAEKMGFQKEAYQKYVELAYDYPASREAAYAEAQAERLRAEFGPADPAAFPPPSYDQKFSRTARLMDGFMYEEAIQKIEALLAEGPAPEQEAELRFSLGSALFKARLRDKAKSVFERFSRDFPGHEKRGMSDYYAATIYWNQEKVEESKNMLERLAKEGANGVRGLALYSLGRIAEAEGDFAAAGQNYAQAQKAGAPARLREDILWRLGWVEYKRGNFKEAAEAFARGEANTDGKNEDGRFIYWQTKAYRAAGDWEREAAAESELFRKYPYTYYGLAEKTSSLQAGPAPNSIVDVPAPKPDLADAPGGLSPESRLRLDRALLLIKAGSFSRAEKELDLILPEVRKDAYGLAWLGGLYSRAGAANRVLSLFGPAPNGGGNNDDLADVVWRMIYPVVHWDKIAGESVKSNMDPLLALSVIRQESSFNNLAVSPANAIGLMQIVPRTGEKIYRQIGLDKETGAPFSRELLFTPKVNIAIGVAYLSTLLERYDGALARALAAYNAGEPAVDLWQKRIGGAPPEEFIEMIPYNETRDYVKKVLRNLALYRSIYSRVELTAKPSAGQGPAM